MKYRLFDVCNYITDKIDSDKISIEDYISTENMVPNKGGIVRASSLPNINKILNYKKDDILISNIRPYFKKIWFADKEGGCSNDVLIFRAKDGVYPQFLYYMLMNDTFFDYAMLTSKGTKMPRGDKKALMEYEIPKFSFEKQRKTANVLSAIENKIKINKEINNNLVA